MIIGKEMNSMFKDIIQDKIISQDLYLKSDNKSKILPEDLEVLQLKTDNKLYMIRQEENFMKQNLKSMLLIKRIKRRLRRN